MMILPDSAYTRMTLRKSRSKQVATKNPYDMGDHKPHVPKRALALKVIECLNRVVVLSVQRIYTRGLLFSRAFLEMHGFGYAQGL